jgi:hypothetical protein
MGKLFPDIGDALQERARVRADKAELHPSNSMIALIQYYRQQAAFLRDKGRDAEGARLYEMMADMALQQLAPQQNEAQTQPNQTFGMARPEATPQLPSGQRVRATQIGE